MKLEDYLMSGVLPHKIVNGGAPYIVIEGIMHLTTAINGHLGTKLLSKLNVDIINESPYGAFYYHDENEVTPYPIFRYGILKVPFDINYTYIEPIDGFTKFYNKHEL